MDVSPLTLTYVSTQGVLVVEGEIDETNVEHFTASIRQHAEATTQALLVNLDAVTFLPSHAVGALATISQDTEQRVALVARPDTIAGRILTVTNIAHLDTLPSATPKT